MIEEHAKVVRVEPGVAHLEIERSRPCALCGSSRSCGVSLWSRLFGYRARPFKVDDTLGVAVGDRVIVGIDESTLLGGSLRTYLLPGVLACLGGLFGASMTESPGLRDLYAVMGALGGLLAGWCWALTRSNRDSFGRFRPVMLRRAELDVIHHCSR
ncbi:MAG: SoxR reducing system RseC family protein [Methylophilaceae bacterium]|nr:SoxR reducing system RseC family protein [Methylophilaceae bacterium]